MQTRVRQRGGGEETRANGKLMQTDIDKRRQTQRQKCKQTQVGEQKADKEKSHKGIWWSECPPGSVPGKNSGRPRDTWDVWADLCGNSYSRGRTSAWKFICKGQNVRGTDGTYNGTDGTCLRDRWAFFRGCPAKILYVYWFFFPK